MSTVMREIGMDDLENFHVSLQSSFNRTKEQVKELMHNLLLARSLSRKADIPQDYVVDYLNEHNVTSFVHHIQVLSDKIKAFKERNTEMETLIRSVRDELIPTSDEIKGLLFKVFHVVTSLTNLESGYTAKVFFLRQLYDSGKIDLTLFQRSVLETP